MEFNRILNLLSSCILCCFIGISLYFIHSSFASLCLCCLGLWVQFQWDSMGSLGVFLGLSVFCGSVGFHWVFGSVIFLLISLILSSILCFCDLNFLFRFPPWNHYKLQRNVVCCVIYRIKNQCLYVFLNKVSSWLSQ